MTTDEKIERLQQLASQCLEMGADLGFTTMHNPVGIHIEPRTGMVSIHMYGEALSVTRGGSGFTSGDFGRALDMAIEHLEEKQTRLHALCTGAVV